MTERDCPRAIGIRLACSEQTRASDAHTMEYPMSQHTADDDEDTPIEPVEIEVIQILFPSLVPA